MISRTFDFFPFNMGSGPEFLVFYAGLAIGAFVLAAIARRVAGWLLDRGASSVGNARLRVGKVPHADDCLAIAYLREGERGVANTLISEAVAEGWLGPPTKDKKTFTFGQVPPSRKAARRFYQALAGHKKT